MPDPANSVAVAAGSPVVSGHHTSFVAAEFDLFILNGITVAIASRDSTSQVTLKHPWPGESATGAMGWEIANTGPYWHSTVATNRQLAALLGKFEAGPVKWDASGSLAGRDVYNNQGIDFVYLAVDPLPFRLYVKLVNSNSASDWSLPQTLGERGEVAFETAIEAERQARAAALENKVTRGHTLVADADYQCLPSDVQVGVKPLMAPRTISLPDVDTFPLGQDLVIADESGACSDALAITIQPGAGTGDIIGGPEGPTTIVLSSPYQAVRFRRGAANLWIRL
ncbi:hypothetical protein FHR71_004475 [Methylobacterium sp. RAS18]|nr:hypothetical protein [Methylobacterium sp. RAS18]